MSEDGAAVRARAAGYAVASDAPSIDWTERFAATTAALAVVDLATETLAFTTPAFDRLHGHAPGALRGAAVAALCPADARPALAEAMGRIAAEGVVPYATRHQRADGAAMSVRVHASALGAGDRSVRFCALTVEDLSAQSAAEAALRASERLLNEAQRVARVGGWEWDVASGRLTWSDTIRDLFGVSPEHAPTTFEGYLALVHPDDRATARAAAERALADHQPFALDHRVVRPDGVVRTLRGRGEVVVDAVGRVARLVGSSTDVTERRAAERAEHEARAAAERAAERIRALHVMSNALANALSAAEVSELIVRQGLEAVGADAAFVARLRDDGETVELLRADGLPPALARDYATFPLAARVPPAEVIRTGAAVWVERARARDERYGDLADRAMDVVFRALATLPLVVDGRPLGAVGFAFREARPFADDDRSFLGALASQYAQALLRANLFEGSQSARAAEELLAAAGRALADSLDHEVTLQRVLELTVPAVADWAVVYRAEPAGTIRRLATAGPQDVCAAFAELEARHPLRLDAPGSVSLVVRDGAEVFVPDVGDGYLVGEAAMNPAHADALRRLRYRSVVIVPLRAHDAVLGALLLGTGPSGRRLGLRERDLARRLADRAALAIESSRLYADERRARADAEAARRRTAFLAEASRVLGESFDYTATLQHVAQSFVPEMADWCAVDLLADGGGVELVAVAHADGATAAWARALRERCPVSTRDATGIGRVLREGTSEFAATIDDALPANETRGGEEIGMLHAIGHGSFMCVPLLVRGAVIGAITFAYAAESERRYDDADLALAEELARRAATAIDHARAYRAAHVASQVKSQFLAVMSHELRTPLNAIGGYVELLELELRGPITDAQRRDLGRIRVSQQHLLGLISAVLDLSRVESGRVSYAIEAVPVDAFLQSLDALIAPQVAAKSLTLEYHACPPSLGVLADREKLRQVVLNLLSNAVRYTPAGGRVSLRAERRAHAVAIVVTDTGMGIPADALERIFEPFVQLDRTITPAREGVGLGLAISRDLARGMAGDLAAASRAGEGSTFTLTLPGAAAGAWAATGEMPATPGTTAMPAAAPAG